MVVFVTSLHGGLGLPPTAHTANVAHVASVLDTVPYLRNMHPDLAAFYNATLQSVLQPADPASSPPASLGPVADAFTTAFRNMGPTPEASAQCIKIATVVVRTLLGLPAEGQEGAAQEGAGQEEGAAQQGAGQEEGAAQQGAAAQQDAAQSERLQFRLSQPVYAALGAAYTRSIAGDALRTAQHLSQRSLPSVKGTGFLATSWLTTMPWKQRIESADLRVALLLYLGLPDNMLASGAVPCNCGSTLATDSVVALQHISGCNRHCKTFAHDIFGRGPTGPFSTVLTSMGGGALVAFEQSGYPAAGCKMDLVARGVPGYGGALAIDYTLTNPTNQATLNNASLVPLYCANEAHKDKIAHYQPLMPAGDVFVPIAVELYGGVHASVVDTLRSWAERLAQGGAAKPGVILGLLRQSFSLSLMRARVELYRHCIGHCIEPDAAARRRVARQAYFCTELRRAERRAKVHLTISRPGGGGGARTLEGRFGRSR